MKKVKILEELNSLGLLDHKHGEKEIYGADKYKDWLTTQGLQIDGSGMSNQIHLQTAVMLMM